MPETKEKSTVFDENQLREALIKTFGENSDHLTVYNKILKAGRAYIDSRIHLPVTIKTIDKDNKPTEPISVDEGTGILYHKGNYYVSYYGKEIQIPTEEFKRLWTVIRFQEIVGKNGAWFRITKQTV